MTIHFQCNNCGGPVKVADETAGKKGRCPHCTKIIEIPPPNDRPSASAPAAEHRPRGELHDTPAAIAATPLPPVPPPPATARKPKDAIELDAELDRSPTKDPNSETDILPAEQQVAPPKARPPKRTNWVAALFRPSKGKGTSSKARVPALLTVLVIALIVVAIIVVVVLLVLRAR